MPVGALQGSRKRSVTVGVGTGMGGPGGLGVDVVLLRPAGSHSEIRPMPLSPPSPLGLVALSVVDSRLIS